MNELKEIENIYKEMCEMMIAVRLQQKWSILRRGVL